MKDSSEDNAKDATGSILQRKCTTQQKEGSNEKDRDRGQVCPCPTPHPSHVPLWCSPGRWENALQIPAGAGKREVLGLGHLQDGHSLAPSSGSTLLQISLSQHSRAVMPWIKCLNILQNAKKDFFFFFFSVEHQRTVWGEYLKDKHLQLNEMNPTLWLM